MVEKTEEISQSRKIIGFVLTLILVPLLFAGTCVPVGFLLISARSQGVIIGGFIVYGLVFLALVIRKARITENLGIKWGGFVALVLLSIVLGIFWLSLYR